MLIKIELLERESSSEPIEGTVSVVFEPVFNAISVEVVATLLDSAYFLVASVLLKETPSVQPRQTDRTLLVQQSLRNLFLLHHFQSCFYSRKSQRLKGTIELRLLLLLLLLNLS